MSGAAEDGRAKVYQSKEEQTWDVPEGAEVQEKESFDSSESAVGMTNDEEGLSEVGYMARGIELPDQEGDVGADTVDAQMH